MKNDRLPRLVLLSLFAVTLSTWVGTTLVVPAAALARPGRPCQGVSVPFSNLHTTGACLVEA